jgi:sortase A
VTDRRRVDDLSTEELAKLLRIRRREERLKRARHVARDGEQKGSGRAYPNGRQPSELDVAAHVGPQTEEADAADSGNYGSAQGLRRRRIRDRALVVVEAVLAVALLAVLVGSLGTLREVNEASRKAQQMVVPTATPLIRVVVLPAGHTPPDSPGGAAPEEIPAHLRDRIDAITPLPVPTSGPEQVTRIRIPSIGVDAPVVEGDDWESLKQGAGHHVGSANPGEQGNCVISAHNDIFGEIFRRLSDVALGDEVLVHTVRQVHRYVVTQKRIIEPSEVSVMHPTSGPILTLISCHPYGVDTHRIVVTAELQS